MEQEVLNLKEQIRKLETIVNEKKEAEKIDHARILAHNRSEALMMKKHRRSIVEKKIRARLEVKMERAINRIIERELAKYEASLVETDVDLELLEQKKLDLKTAEKEAKKLAKQLEDAKLEADRAKEEAEKLIEKVESDKLLAKTEAEKEVENAKRIAKKFADKAEKAEADSKAKMMEDVDAEIEAKAAIEKEAKNAKKEVETKPAGKSPAAIKPIKKTKTSKK